MPWFSSIKRIIDNLLGSCRGHNDADNCISERASSFEFSGPTHHNGTGYIKKYVADDKISEIQEINLQIQSNRNEISSLCNNINDSINYYRTEFSLLGNRFTSCADDNSLEAQRMHCITSIISALGLISQNYENIYISKITNNLEAVQSHYFDEGLTYNHLTESSDLDRMISRDREYIAGQKNLIIYLISSRMSVDNLAFYLSVDCLRNAVDHLANIINMQVRELREMQHSIELDSIEGAESIDTDSHRSPSPRLSDALSISSESLYCRI